MKKVVFIMVDSLMPSILEQCFQARVTPALKFLYDNGQYRPDCVTSFPTMTASVDSSLVTGTYPDVHKVPGLIWYDPEQKEIINYINGLKCVWKSGIQQCVRNVLLNLNEQHLSKNVRTVFEELSARNHTSASINLIIHRGKTRHSLRVPYLFRLLLNIQSDQKISGPELLFMGAACYPSFLEKHIKHLPVGLKGIYGINDQFAIDTARLLIREERQPSFMMIYLPDNDHRIHRQTPEDGLLSVIKVDQQIQSLLSEFGSWKNALEHNIFIVTSDHGQTRVGKEKHFNINLDHLLSSYRTVQLGESVTNEHQLVVCNNERMSYVYPLDASLQDRIIHDLAKESRIDLIAWKEGQSIQVMEGGTKRRLTYRKNGGLFDPYEVRWDIEGELSVLDMKIEHDKITYGDYPDALSRLYGALFAQDCPSIVVTARPKHQFESRHYPTHNNGGSHGSLHKWDSTIPLLVAGTKQKTELPPRIVDFKGYMMDLMPPRTM